MTFSIAPIVYDYGDKRSVELLRFQDKRTYNLESLKLLLMMFHFKPYYDDDDVQDDDDDDDGWLKMIRVMN
jgi:hypothetical protein